MIKLAVVVCILQKVFARAAEARIDNKVFDVALKIPDIRKDIEIEDATREQILTIADVAVARLGNLGLRIENDAVRAADDKFAATEADLAVFSVQFAEINGAAVEGQPGNRLVLLAVVDKG